MYHAIHIKSRITTATGITREILDPFATVARLRTSTKKNNVNNILYNENIKRQKKINKTL